MSTKPPSTVQEAAAGSIEKIAYASVSGVKAREMNDLNRLGYHIWRWLTTKEGTLEQAVAESGARIDMPHSEAVAQIRAALAASGIQAG